jgi:hypothetical protein
MASKPGKARHGPLARKVKARLLRLVSQGKARQGNAPRQGKARLDKDRQSKARLGNFRQG